MPDLRLGASACPVVLPSMEILERSARSVPLTLHLGVRSSPPRPNSGVSAALAFYPPGSGPGPAESPARKNAYSLRASNVHHHGELSGHTGPSDHTALAEADAENSVAVITVPMAESELLGAGDGGGDDECKRFEFKTSTWGMLEAAVEDTGCVEWLFPENAAREILDKRSATPKRFCFCLFYRLTSEIWKWSCAKA